LIPSTTAEKSNVACTIQIYKLRRNPFDSFFLQQIFKNLSKAITKIRQYSMDMAKYRRLSLIKLGSKMETLEIMKIKI